MFVRGARGGRRGRGRREGVTVGDVEGERRRFVVCAKEGGAVFVEFVTQDDVRVTGFVEFVDVE